jgi:hypothetical protein
MIPVRNLPITDLTVTVEVINPVIPSLGSGWNVNVTKALLALLDHRKDLGGEGFACVCEKDDGRNV